MGKSDRRLGRMSFKKKSKGRRSMNRCPDQTLILPPTEQEPRAKGEGQRAKGNTNSVIGLTGLIQILTGLVWYLDHDLTGCHD